MRGFTLIEILITMVILVLVALSAIGAQILSQRAAVYTEHKEEALYLLQNRGEEIWSLPFDDVKGTRTSQKMEKGNIYYTLNTEGVIDYMGGNEMGSTITLTVLWEEEKEGQHTVTTSFYRCSSK